MSLHLPLRLALLGLHLPPRVALLLTLGLMTFLFRRDIRQRPNISGALWLPVLWLVLSCSRGFSAWLHIFGISVGGASSVEEGSPLDAFLYFVIIVAGFFVLANRGVDFSQIVQKNGWVIAFLLYCLISILWSDFPLVAFKRWIKVLGHPTMALIVLTERDRKEAVIRLMKRCAYVVVPVSILFIKYFPNLGRSYEDWSGVAINNGIAMGKNSLGADCMILGFSWFWYYLQARQQERSKDRRREIWLIVGFGLGISWLLKMAHSATALTTLFVGIFMVVLVGRRFINTRHIGTYIVSGLVLLATAELTFDLSARFSEALGRGSSFSGRTGVWAYLLGLHTNPLIGTGFESFWLGDRLRQIAEAYWWHPNEAHNGYLEIYLTLGAIGLLILAGFIVATFWKVRAELLRDFEWGRYRLGFFLAVVLYNWTEAGFKTLHPVGFAFYLIALDYRRTRPNDSQQFARIPGEGRTREFAYAEEEL